MNNTFDNAYASRLKDSENYSELFRYCESFKDSEPEAVYQLALCYLNGYGTDKAYEKAFHLLKAAADSNQLEALNDLGCCYIIGKGTEQNPDLALACFKEAAEKGLAAAQCNLADIYLEKKDFDNAYKWYMAAAEQDDPYANYEIANYFLTRENDERTAIDWILKSARLGYPNAQFDIAQYYYDGELMPQNRHLAYEYLTKAAAQGHKAAQCALCALGHEHEISPIKSSNDSSVLSSSQSNALKQYNDYLNLIQLGEQNVAIKSLKKSAKHGFAGAQTTLGDIYFLHAENGLNAKEAFKWYKEAAKQIRLMLLIIF